MVSGRVADGSLLGYNDKTHCSWDSLRAHMRLSDFNEKTHGPL